MKTIERIFNTLLITGAFGASLFFWAFVIVKVSRYFSITDIAVIGGLLFIAAAVYISTYGGGADSDETKTQ